MLKGERNLIGVFVAIKQWTDSMLGNYLFQAAKLTTNFYPDKYKYSTYGIGFHPHESFRLSDGSGFGKKLIIFGADISQSVHVDNKKNIS